MATMKAKLNLTNLNDDILLEIVKYLKPMDILNLKRSSKRFDWAISKVCKKIEIFELRPGKETVTIEMLNQIFELFGPNIQTFDFAFVLLSTKLERMILQELRKHCPQLKRLYGLNFHKIILHTDKLPQNLECCDIAFSYNMTMDKFHNMFKECFHSMQFLVIRSIYNLMGDLTLFGPYCLYGDVFIQFSSLRALTFYNTNGLDILTRCEIMENNPEIMFFEIGCNDEIQPALRGQACLSSLENFDYMRKLLSWSELLNKI